MNEAQSPQRLYRYSSSKYGLWTLQNRCLRVSRIEELNDPFEFLAPELIDPQYRQIIRSVKAHLNKTKGIVYFAENRKSPLMWAHYAERHEGLCLGFDVVAGDALGRVKYVTKRLKWPGKLEYDFAQALLLTKFSHWRYEREWRAFMSLDDCQECDGHYVKPFSDDLVLREVYTGVRSEMSLRESVEGAVHGLHGVRVWNTREAFRTFDVVQRRGSGTVSRSVRG